jgi:L,D-transpeptidase catalytic domain
MSFASLRPFVVALASVALFSGCAGYPPMQPFFGRFGSGISAPPKLDPPPVDAPEKFWKGEGATGDPTIVVRRGEQRAYFYRGRKVVGATRVSTGKKGFTTPTGSYKVIQKNRHHVSNLYGDYVDAEGTVVKANVDTGKDPVPEGASFRGAKMPYFLRFYAGYGLHAGRVPNYPASHGCIRLPSEMARHFYENVSMGTPVRVEE